MSLSREMATYRPPIMGNTHMVSSGHYLATQAGFRILEAGGNAIDAGVAAGLALNVTQPHRTSFGGVAPIILYLAGSETIVTVSGLGSWPEKASIDYYREHYGGDMPPGVARTVVPAAADAWLTALAEYGTFSFQEVVGPALELAERGFPVQQILHQHLKTHRKTLEQWPSTWEAFTVDGEIPEIGAILKQPDLARSFRRLIEVERRCEGQGREIAIRAARDEFYRGDMAREMVDFCQSQGGLLTMRDMENFTVGREAPERGTYKDYSIYTCGPWCQGPLLIQALNVLEEINLREMKHNSVDYIHTVTEALKLVFADRHYYYGDPRFVDVPMEELLSKKFAAQRRKEIDLNSASPGLPSPGPISIPHNDVMEPLPNGNSRPDVAASDTSYVCVVDQKGNAFSATPSDFMENTPVVPGLGFLISHRGEQSWLEQGMASSLQPGKRPRLTPNPALSFKNGKLFLPFGTPGGDVQVQAMLQMFLNIVEFGMDPQQAVEEPRFATFSFPNSFWPHEYYPGALSLEGRISAKVTNELSRRGHRTRSWLDWDDAAGGLCGILVDQEKEVLVGGADPRRESYAIGR